MHGQRLYVDARRDCKQDVAHVKCLPDGEFGSVSLVVSPAFVLLRLRAADLALDHGLKNLPLGLAQLRRHRPSMLGQQLKRHRALAQQLSIRKLAQFACFRALPRRMQGDAIDGRRGHVLRADHRSTGSGATATASAATTAGIFQRGN